MKNNKIIIVGIIILTIISIYLFFNSTTIKNNNSAKLEDNQVIYKNISESDIPEIYFSDFIETIKINRESAYDLLDDDYKVKITFDEFDLLLDEVEEKNEFEIKLVSYKVIKNDNYKLFYVKDEDDNVYVFKEKSIMNYTVYLDENSVEI